MRARFFFFCTGSRERLTTSRACCSAIAARSGARCRRSLKMQRKRRPLAWRPWPSRSSHRWVRGGMPSEPVALRRLTVWCVPNALPVAGGVQVRHAHGGARARAGGHCQRWAVYCLRPGPLHAGAAHGARRGQGRAAPRRFPRRRGPRGPGQQRSAACAAPGSGPAFP